MHAAHSSKETLSFFMSTLNDAGLWYLTLWLRLYSNRSFMKTLCTLLEKKPLTVSGAVATYKAERSSRAKMLSTPATLLDGIP